MLIWENMEFTGIKIISYFIWNIRIPSNRAYTANTWEASCAYQKLVYLDSTYIDRQFAHCKMQCAKDIICSVCPNHWPLLMVSIPLVTWQQHLGILFLNITALFLILLLFDDWYLRGTIIYLRCFDTVFWGPYLTFWIGS